MGSRRLLWFYLWALWSEMSPLLGIPFSQPLPTSLVEKRTHGEISNFLFPGFILRSASLWTQWVRACQIGYCSEFHAQILGAAVRDFFVRFSIPYYFTLCMQLNECQCGSAQKIKDASIPFSNLPFSFSNSMYHLMLTVYTVQYQKLIEFVLELKEYIFIS